MERDIPSKTYFQLLLYLHVRYDKPMILPHLLAIYLSVGLYYLKYSWEYFMQKNA